MDIRHENGVCSDQSFEGFPRRLRRRDLLRLTVGGGTGLALGGILDLAAVKASAQTLQPTCSSMSSLSPRRTMA